MFRISEDFILNQRGFWN